MLTPYEERSISRVAFFRSVHSHSTGEATTDGFRFAGFLLSCVAISFAAARGRGVRGAPGLLGVV